MARIASGNVRSREERERVTAARALGKTYRPHLKLRGSGFPDRDEPLPVGFGEEDKSAVACPFHTGELQIHERWYPRDMG